MRRAEARPARAVAGITLLELMLVFTLIGVLVAWASPRFAVAVEQTRVDQAAASLRSVWLAERLHWLEHKTFTDDLGELAAQRYIDAPLVAQTTPFLLSIDSADEQAFEASAERTGSGAWTGVMSIDETGVVAGSTQDEGGHHVAPAP